MSLPEVQIAMLLLSIEACTPGTWSSPQINEVALELHELAGLLVNELEDRER
jgi:hypothetical protein